MNVELLEKVAARLRRLRHHKHFDMDVFAEKTACGTAACVAGHAMLMSGYKLVNEHEDGYEWQSPSGHIVAPFVAAQKLLELNKRQAIRLFNANNWPEQFGGGKLYWSGEQYNDPKVAADRIDRFIATKGKE